MLREHYTTKPQARFICSVYRFLKYKLILSSIQEIKLDNVTNEDLDQINHTFISHGDSVT